MSLSLDDLESHLFKCADIIRDAVDPTDYKEYILPLVYYKSISDEFEKQYADKLNKYGQEDLARNPDLYDVPVVPDGYLWDDLRAVSDNIDQALNEAFDAVTDENPELKGVFRADYIDADALNDDRLGKLVEHLTTYDLDRDSIPPDMLGEEYLEEIETLDNPGVKASQIAHATQDHLRPRTEQNPRYKRLSERVTEIVERWQGGDVADPEAVEALKSVEEEIQDVDQKAGDNSAEQATFAISTYLSEELDNGVESDEKASEIAEDVVNSFEERIDRSYPGWETNQTTIQGVVELIYEVFIVEHDRSDLVDEALVDTIRGYLINNYA